MTDHQGRQGHKLTARMRWILGEKQEHADTRERDADTESTHRRSDRETDRLSTKVTADRS